MAKVNAKIIKISIGVIAYFISVLLFMIVKLGWGLTLLELWTHATTIKGILDEKRSSKKHGEKPDKYLAIESNPKTRAMYKKLGITAYSKQDFI